MSHATTSSAGGETRASRARSLAATVSFLCGWGLLSAASIVAGGCDFDESVRELTCDVEGAHRGDRVCRGGRWVPAPDAWNSGDVGDDAAECDDGDIRESSRSCGADDRGEWRQKCVDGRWTNVECEGGWYRSCDAYLDAHPDAESGEYELDIDGAGGRDPQAAYCRMEGDKGWTLVAYDDFEDDVEGWSSEVRDDCGEWGSILGGFCKFGSGEVEKTYGIAEVPHERAKLMLEFIQIDTWDAGRGDEGRVLFEDQVVWRDRLSGRSGEHQCGLEHDFARDSLTEVEGTVGDGSRREYTVTAGATLGEVSCDESWGIDDVRIFVR